jgi:class 3 adenylate cyclase
VQERRIVSVLFADLVGFTSRSERLDIEDVQELLAPYHASLQTTIEQYGGGVCKFMGDGAMALFGAPTAHEDDPERAVRAALEICERIGALRVGVTSGEALVTLGDDAAVDAVGDVVNTAARLESAAPVGGVLVDEPTHRRTSSAIRYAETDPLTAKGKSEPVPVWRALEPRSAVPEQARAAGLRLVGRDREWSLLVAQLDRSRAGPSGQLVSLIGEPGIGKTRLVEELAAHMAALPDRVTYRRGRSLAYGEGVAFWALGEMVKAQAGILESDSVDVAGSKLSEAVDALMPDVRDRPWVTEHLRPLVGLERHAAASLDSARGEAFEAWRRFFEALADEQPAVLVFEDVHWADDALLDFIELLAAAVGALIVCTARPELLERRPGWGGMTIALASLSDEDTARLLGELLGQVLLPAELQQALLERIEGNPLYAQEYVRMLQDRGLLAEVQGGWKLTGTVEGLPESIHGIIAARLDALSADEKALVHDASVVGKTAWIGVVATLSGRSAGDAEALLRGVERKQLIQRLQPSSIEGETEFRFAHALIRDVAYSQIRRKDRASKHEAAADWIERLAGEREDKAELLADHYQRALGLRDQLGEDTTALAAKARVAFTEAARQAAAVHAHLAAARHYRSALTLTAADDPQRPALLFGQCTELFEAGEADERTLRIALDAQIEAEQWEAAAHIERMLFYWFQEGTGEGDVADAHLAQAAQYAARVPPSDVMCHIASEQALRLAVTGRADEAFALTDRLVPIAARARLPVGEALLLQWRGSSRAMLGDPDGRTEMRAAADTLAAHSHPATPGAYGNLAEDHRDFGDLAAADEAYRRAHEWAVRLASALYLDWIVAMMASQAYHAARWDDARELLSRIDTTNRYDATEARVTSGFLELGCGGVDQALGDADDIIGYAEGIRSDGVLYCGLALRARCLAAAGRPAEALATCRRFLQRWQESVVTVAGAIELCEMADVLAANGEHETLRQAATVLPAASRWRDALLAIADEEYSRAAAVFERIGSHPLAANAHLLAAGHGEPEQHAAAVVAFAERSGATLYRELAAAHMPPAPTPPPSPPPPPRPS